MKAMIFQETGEPADILHIREIPDPTPGPDETLVRVVLSAMHPADLHMMRGASVEHLLCQPVSASNVLALLRHWVPA